MADSEPEVVVRDPRDLPAFPTANLTSRIIADETVGVEHVSVGEVTFEPGAVGDPHVREVEEIVFVLEGTAGIVTEETAYTIAEGQAAIIPPGTHHHHENVGDGRLRKLWIFAPPGPERGIREREADDDG